MSLVYPGGKRFAFSVFDDTDVATLESIRPLYDYLHELGIITTKSVWGIDHDGKSDYEGSDTLDNLPYAQYVKLLRDRGFEIGYHGATMQGATRTCIERSLANYVQLLGRYPRICSAHSLNQDNLYWGVDRFSLAATRSLYLLLGGEGGGYYQGHVPESQYFWGDLARQHLEYVRSFTFRRANLLKLNTPVVYRREDTPWVKNWFITSDAENVEEFNSLIDSPRQNDLEEQGGMCIISTHFGKGFVDNDRINANTMRLLEELSNRDCWFAPVSELLDFYVGEFGCAEMSTTRLLSLELRWFLDSLDRRLRRKRYKPTEITYLRKSTGK
jgi:hypothetical protein